MFTLGRLTTSASVALVASLIFNLSALAGTCESTQNSTPAATKAVEAAQRKLEAGEVVTSCEDINGTKYIVGRILIDDTPEHIWPTLVNPYEFEHNFCKRIKKLEIIADQPHLCIMNATLGIVFPIPDIHYVVESKYTGPSRVEFRRISGSLKDFRGFWGLEPVGNGRSEVTYSMYLDPGFPVPEWILHAGMKQELPNVLNALKTRVLALKRNSEPPLTRNIRAATTYGATALAPTLPAALPTLQR